MKKLNHILIIIIITLLNLRIEAQSQIDSIPYYYDKGDLDKAILFGENVMKSYELNKKISHPDYVQSLNNLAFLYVKLGFYKKAESMYIKALEIRRKTLGEDHLDYATSLNYLGLFYKKQEEYQKAEPLYLQSLAIRKKILGENHLDYVVVLTNLASLYYNKGEFQKAEALFLQSLIIKKNIIGENDPDYAYSLNYLASIYQSQGEYAKAEPLFLQTLSITKSILGENHPNYISSLNNLASLYQKQGEYQKAESLYLRSLAISKTELGENHVGYALALNNLALLYQDQGEYQKAEPLYLQSLDIYKKKIGENHTDYALALNNLALLYQNQGDYNKAEPLYLQSLDIFKKKIGENHPDYALSLNNLAGLYVDLGEYNKAEPLYLQSLDIFKIKLGENHPDYALSLNNLASFYVVKEEFQKAETFYNQSIIVRKNVLGENHPEYATSLNNLGVFYLDQGDYQKAVPLFLKSKFIRKEVLGENHPEYIQSLNNLAVLFDKSGEYQIAENLYLEIISIAKNIFGENHIVYSLYVNNLGEFYRNQKNYIKAEPLLLKSLAIRKNILGENHPDFSLTLNNLALLYKSQGDYKKAETLYLKSLAINKMVLGENNTNYALTLENLAIFYQSINPENKEKAAFYLQALFLQFQNHIKLASTYKTEKELSFFRIKNFDNRFLHLSFLCRNPKQYYNINIGCFENELLVKNLSLSNQKQITNNIKKSRDKDLQNKYEQFILNKKQLVKLNELPKDKRLSNYEQINSETETLEKDLVRQSSSFADSKNALSINWKQVQAKLKTNELAIDLIAFNYFNKKWTDSIVYGAFVVGRDYKAPKFIPLFEQKQLEILLAGNDETKQRDKINKQYTNKAISDLFLNPLQKELNGISTIYLSPSGLSHQIDFSALLVSENQTLGEKYQVHILGSTAEIVNYKEAGLDKKNNLDLLLYGGIDYEKSDTVNKIYSEKIENEGNSEFATLATRSGISKWSYLDGTKKEVEKINNKSQQNGFVSTIINGRLATEESIKKLDGRTTPYVLHLATHGFFFPDTKQELPDDNLQLTSEIKKAKIYKTSDDPMMRSGLLFAGANNYWGKTAENMTIDDGILTASEISNLDLSACQLAVLSACETGLGEIKGSEGVFGLQRAFKMAGVKNIIMSLWKVPDAQTAELFELFYNECFAGKSFHEAFQSAQAKMKAKYSPYYWAGFVLLE